MCVPAIGKIATGLISPIAALGGANFFGGSKKPSQTTPVTASPTAATGSSPSGSGFSGYSSQGSGL